MSSKYLRLISISWTDNKIIRFLQAGSFKNDKTLHSIKNYTTWRETKLPINMDKKLQDFLVLNTFELDFLTLFRTLALSMSMEEIIILDLS